MPLIPHANTAEPKELKPGESFESLVSFFVFVADNLEPP